MTATGVGSGRRGGGTGGIPRRSVSIWKTVDRRYKTDPKTGKKVEWYKRQPWIVRWKVEGKECSRSFSNKAQADSFRAELLVAANRGEPFNFDTGEPTSWARTTFTCAEWAAEYVRLQWPKWSPNSRRSSVEGLRAVLPLMLLDRAGVPPSNKKNPDGWKNLDRYLRDHLLNPGDTTKREDWDPLEVSCHGWMRKKSLPLVRLDKTAAERIYIGLGELTWKEDRGKPKAEQRTLARNTVKRYRETAKALLNAAVDRSILQQNPWPRAASLGTTVVQKLSAQNEYRYERSLCLDPPTFRTVAKELINHKESSRRYYTAMSILYFAGLRPGEMLILTSDDCTLPDYTKVSSDTWGSISITKTRRSTEARWLIDEGELDGPTKTGKQRKVPIPPELVRTIQDHIARFGTGDLFTASARAGRPPGHISLRNVERAWHLSKVKADPGPTPKKGAKTKTTNLRTTLYDLRHSNATLLISSGVPFGEVARRLGHSVAVLLEIYAGVMVGEEAAANKRIQEMLNSQRNLFEEED